MLAIVLSAFVPRMTTADSVCFWIGAEGGTSEGQSTDCEVCVFQDRSDKRVEQCQTGWTKQKTCYDFGSGELRENLDLYVRTSAHCHDALWINKMQVIGDHGSFNYIRGDYDKRGWCISQDRNDHLDWSNEYGNVYVPAGQCFHTLKWDTSGQAWGWMNDQELYCRHRKSMSGCKQDCPTGWSVYETFADGCCAGWGSCFGNKKRCHIDYPCNRKPYPFLFYGCPRGEGASSWVYKGHYDLHMCQNMCDSDQRCTAFETNGCHANPMSCGGACYLFYGTKGGAIYNGNCVTNGDQRAYRRVFGSRRRVGGEAGDDVPESWTEEDGVTVEELPMSEQGGTWVELTPADVTDETALLERLQKREAGSTTEDDVEGAATEDDVEGSTTEDDVEGPTTEDVVEEKDTRRLV